MEATPKSPSTNVVTRTAESREQLEGEQAEETESGASARVAQEVYEPLIGIHYPMLCTVKNGNWQIGTGFFLHEWRRCVRRLCTSHLSRVSRELPARLQPNRGRNKTKQAPTKPNTTKTNTKRKGEQPVV